jgi:alkylation response protein AidB-like acyl-CoA dehydrogenase
MDFTLSEEQEMLRKSAREFLEDRCSKALVREMESDERGYSPELWQEMAGLGWMGLAFPERYGGGGMGFLELAVLLEEMGRACLPGPFFASVVLGGLTILDAGSQSQKDRYLPGVASGQSTFTFALTEADGRYEPDSVALTARMDGANYVLDGTKLFVPDAHVADRLLCLARSDQAALPGEGLTVFIVDGASPGISRFPLKTIAGDKQCEVVFQEVRVPAEDVLGEPGQGWPVAWRAIERAAVAKSCELVGGLQKVLEMTLDYARERRQFNRPIGSFQVIQHYCAQMAADVDGARFSTYQAAWMLSKGLPCSRQVAIAKAWAGDAYERVLTLAHQIHGAIGCTIDHDLHFYTTRGKAAQLSFGGGDLHRETVAREMGL